MLLTANVFCVLFYALIVIYVARYARYLCVVLCNHCYVHCMCSLLYVLFDMLDICVLVYVLIVTQYVLLSMLNMLCVALCAHRCICCSISLIFMYHSMCSLLYVLLSMLNILCIALCAA